ncbi:MAG: outer membrane beta-barrel protein [Cryomorphaceae bacterium]|nr:outer membrane beta-barrel protein [Cryomorphaceae bacterium]
MKRTLLVSVFTVISCALATGQTFRWNDVSIYYQGSAHYSRIFNPNFYETEELDVNHRNIRFGGGLGLMYSFSDRFSLSLGADYDRKGAKFREYRRGGYVRRDYTLDYVSVNLMGRYFIRDFNISVGGYYSRLVYEALDFYDDVRIGNEKLRNPGRYLDDDAGIIAEVGYLFDLDYRTKANVALFASYGMLEINRGRYQVNHFQDSYNQSTNFVAGLRVTIFIITQPY